MESLKRLNETINNEWKKLPFWGQLIVVFLVFIVIGLLVDFTFWYLDIVAFFSVYFIVTISLNLQYGYAGVPNFGMVLPVAGGAYVAGALAGRVAMWYYDLGGPNVDYIRDNAFIISDTNARIANDPLGALIIFLITLVVAVVVAFGLGYIASRPAIRLQPTYLIIVLISMGEAIRIIGTNWYPLVGGTTWVNVPDIFHWVGASITRRNLAYMVLLLGFAIFIYAIVQLMTTSPFARVLKAVRENEVSAETLGKDVVGIKTLTILIGSGIAAIGGVLWSFHTGVVLAAAFLRADWTFWPWLMVMIGGMGNNRGSAAGAGGVVVFRRILIFYKHDIEQYVPFSVIWLEQIILGITLLLFIMFRPQGIIPEETIKLRGIPPTEYEKMLKRVKMMEKVEETHK